MADQRDRDDVPPDALVPHDRAQESPAERRRRIIGPESAKHLEETEKRFWKRHVEESTTAEEIDRLAEKHLGRPLKARQKRIAGRRRW